MLLIWGYINRMTRLTKNLQLLYNVVYYSSISLNFLLFQSNALCLDHE